MLISPTRVQMDNNNRSATLVLRNPSNGPRKYRLSWEDKKSLQYGGYSMITEEENLGMELTFTRTGNASSYGGVSVEMQRDTDSPVEIIGESGEFLIFHELDTRTLTVPLRDARIFEGALARIAYTGLQEYEGVLWADKVFKAELLITELASGIQHG